MEGSTEGGKRSEIIGAKRKDEDTLFGKFESVHSLLYTINRKTRTE